MGLAFLFPFIIAALREEYGIGIALGLFSAILFGILGYWIERKRRKSVTTNIAQYFKNHISTENQENLPLFLAALISWAENISYLDRAKEEMLCVCDEIAIVNSQDNETFKRYLSKLAELDEQDSGESYMFVADKMKKNPQSESNQQTAGIMDDDQV